jgi:hypothetical protein
LASLWFLTIFCSYTGAIVLPLYASMSRAQQMAVFQVVKAMTVVHNILAIKHVNN